MSKDRERAIRSCAARQCADQMICSRCGYAWDTNDPAPPACKPRPIETAREIAVEKIRRRLTDD